MPEELQAQASRAFVVPIQIIDGLVSRGVEEIVGRRETLERIYLFECFVVHETGSILGNFKLALLDLLAKLPAGSSAKSSGIKEMEAAAWATRLVRKFLPRQEGDGVTNIVRDWSRWPDKATGCHASICCKVRSCRSISTWAVSGRIGQSQVLQGCKDRKRVRHPGLTNSPCRCNFRGGL